MAAVTASKTWRQIPNLDGKEMFFVVTTASADDTIDLSEYFSTIYSVYGCEVTSGTDALNLSWVPTTSVVTIDPSGSVASKSVSLKVIGESA